MPYVYDPLLQDKDQQGPLGTPPPMTGGGTTFAGGSGGLTSKDPNQQKGANRQGSGFVGLDQYLNANKGSQFGNQVTGNVANSVNSAKQGLTQGAQDFTSASNQGTTRWNDVGDEFKGIVDTAGKDTTDDQKARAKQLEATSYAGPQSFFGTDTAGKVAGGIQKAGQEAKALQSEGGRFALLDQYFGRPNYSTGQKTLDNAIVQGTKGVAAKSNALSNRANQLTEEANQTGRGLENLVAANKQASADTGQKARDYATTSLTNFQDDLNKRYQDFNTGNEAYNQQIQAAAQNLNPQAAERDQNLDIYGLLGLKPDQNLYGLHDFSPYLSAATQPTLSQFSSPEEAARYQALGDIAGGDFKLPINPAEAGTAGTGRVSANKNQVQLAIDQRHRAADTQTNNILQQGRQILNSDEVTGIIDPQERTAATMNRLEPYLDEFEKTYGFRPQITPEMLWQGGVDYNDPQLGSPLITGPDVGGRI
jgi:hypothetical protein